MTMAFEEDFQFPAFAFHEGEPLTSGQREKKGHLEFDFAFLIPRLEEKQPLGVRPSIHEYIISRTHGTA